MKTRFVITEVSEDVVGLHLEEEDNSVYLVDNEGWHILQIDSDGELHLQRDINRIVDGVSVYDIDKEGRLRAHKD